MAPFQPSLDSMHHHAGDQADAVLTAEVLKMRQDLIGFQQLLISELSAIKSHVKDSR